MNVYVESNFVLEHALEQEEFDSCEGIIQMAASGRLRLVIPAFSLAEPHYAISGKAKTRSRLGDDLRVQLGELGRSKPHREIPSRFNALLETLIARAQFEREGLRRTVSQLIKISEILPLDASVLTLAADVELDYGLSAQDAIVLASVLAHLKINAPTESCFVNRNINDFDDPSILERLETLHCKFFLDSPSDSATCRLGLNRKA